MLFEKTRRLETPLETLVKSLERKPPLRVPGTAVFLTSDPSSAPTALLHSLKHYKVLHEKNVILTVETMDVPRAHAERSRQHRAARRDVLARRAALRLHGDAKRAPRARGGAQARLAVRHHVDVVLPVAPRGQAVGASDMPHWQDHLFIGLTRTANDATDYFQIPTGRVVEVGTQVTI